MEAAQLDRDIRALDPSNPVQMAWMNSDLHSNCFAAVIPTEQYDLTNDEFATVAATNAGMPNPACLQHLGVKLVRPKAGDETAGDEDGTQAGAHSSSSLEAEPALVGSDHAPPHNGARVRVTMRGPQ